MNLDVFSSIKSKHVALIFQNIAAEQFITSQ